MNAANFSTGRPATMAPRGMVVSPHSLASQVGLEILKAGGSAVDAAVATSAVLSVVYPHMTGVGGDAFWLIYDAKSKRVRYLDAAGQAASSASIGWFEQRGLQEIPFRGVLPATLTVPGAVDGWCTAHDEFGRLSLGEALAPAIGYARDGFPISARVARWIGLTAADNTFNGDAKRIFMPGSAVPCPGAKLVNPNLARTMAAIAAEGRDGFYCGETAQAMAAFAKANDGFFTLEDFAQQRSRWAEPIATTYRGMTIYETPAPTQGFTVLEMLNLIEPFNVGEWPFLGPDHVHHMVQAKQIAYHDRDTQLADPSFADVPIARLISRSYADLRRKLINSARALAWDEVPSYGSLKGDTVYVGVVDARGNAASLIHSIYGIFGSGVVAGETGVVLQNRSSYFLLDPDHPNRLEAGKRPLHTLIASLAFEGDQLRHVLGCMGADGQPQIHLQTYTGLIDFGLDMQQAVEAPRWLSGRFALGEARDTLNIEGRFATATIEELARRGHAVNRWSDWNELAGHCHGITIDPVSGMRIGGADPRSDGAAIGY
ncbi:MAG: gamma-glutamyltransferase [Betaproteobacteria bacterium]|nr:gamma-glutamyltransferase [Betaproteobacteria bacterium]